MVSAFIVFITGNHHMPISFTSLDELKAFCHSFSLHEPQKRSVNKALRPNPEPDRRSQKPNTTLHRGELASQIKTLVEQFLEQSEPFCAQTIYQCLQQQWPQAAEASVRASFSLIMKKHYAHLNTELRPGAGPRATRYYLPTTQN